LGLSPASERTRRITTPLGFPTRQITKAYRVHEPTRELGLIAMTLFATDFRHLKRRLLVVSAGKSAARRMLSGTSSAGCFPAGRWNGDGTMRYETGTFELRDNGVN
jgi:hypothetical protein